MSLNLISGFWETGLRFLYVWGLTPTQIYREKISLDPLFHNFSMSFLSQVSSWECLACISARGEQYEKEMVNLLEEFVSKQVFWLPNKSFQPSPQKT